MFERSADRGRPLEEIAQQLRSQSVRAVDAIVGAGALRADAGHLILNGLTPQLRPDGVTLTDGVYTLNDIALGQLADKLAIPGPYLRRLADEHLPLFDANVNGWLERTDRRFLIRLLRSGPIAQRGAVDPADLTGIRTQTQTQPARLAGPDGLVRAVLSDRYAQIDNLDVLLAVLDGIRSSGVPIEIDGCDLTERRMHVRIYSPDVQALAPTLLRHYRSPFDTRSGSDLPVVWGGFVVTNSETGCGAFTITPRLMVEVCRNGLVLQQDRLRRTHLGSRNTADDGVVQRSTETIHKTLELITSRTKDAVRTYLDPAYVAEQLRQIETVSDTPVRQPDTTLKVVASRLKFTEQEQDAILAHFIQGADLSAGGVMHAITSVAQTSPDADAAHDLESVAVRAMHLAATTARNS